MAGSLRQFDVPHVRWPFCKVLWGESTNQHGHFARFSVVKVQVHADCTALLSGSCGLSRGGPLTLSGSGSEEGE